MKKLLKLGALLLIPFALLGATNSALYLHHERSTLATLEADLQNREIGLDPTNKSAVGKFSDGTKFHLVSQEMPNVSLTGTLGVTGATVLSNNLTLSLIPTGRIPFTTTGGLFTNASTLAYDGTTLVVNNGTYSGTLGVTGLSTLGRLNVIDSSITIGDGISKGTVFTIQGKTGLTNPYVFNTTTTAGQLDITVNSGADRSVGLTNIGAGLMSLVVEGNVGAATGTFSSTLGAAGITSITNSTATTSSTTGALVVTGGIANAGKLWTAGGTATLQAGNANGEFDLSVKTSRGSVGSPTDVVNGDAPLSFGAFAYSGGSYFSGAVINFLIDGTFTTGQRPPERIEFYTNTANGAQTKQLSIAGSGAAVFTSTVQADSLISSKFYTEGTFTATYVGGTTSPTVTLSYVRVGKQVTLVFQGVSATSNSTSFSYTGLPAALFPATNQMCPLPNGGAEDNSALISTARILIDAAGHLIFQNNQSTSGWTAAGTKFITSSTPCTYTLQ